VLFVVYVLVSRDRAQPRRVYSSGGASGSPIDVEGAQSSQPSYKVRESTGSQNWRQKHQRYATTGVITAGSSPADCSQSAGGKMQSGAGGQKKGQGQMKTSKEKPSASLQHKQTSSSPAAPSSQSPAMPQSASRSHQMPQSISLYWSIFPSVMI